jgi:hypothetical protein
LMEGEKEGGREGGNRNGSSSSSSSSSSSDSNNSNHKKQSVYVCIISNFLSIPANGMAQKYDVGIVSKKRKNKNV